MTATKTERVAALAAPGRERPRRWPRVLLLALGIFVLAALILAWRYGVVGWLLPHTPAPLEVTAEVELSGPIAAQGGEATVAVDPLLSANGTARAELRLRPAEMGVTLQGEADWNAQLADGRGTLLVSAPGCTPNALRLPFPGSVCNAGRSIYAPGEPVPLTLHSQVGRHVAAPGAYVQELELPLYRGAERVLGGSVVRITYRLTAVPDRSGR